MALNDRQPSPPPPPPPLGNGKIPLIKIKLPKTAAKSSGGGGGGGGEEGKKLHMCAACNKSFSSGKALGGHMSSAHVQANKDYSYKKHSSSKRKDPSPDSDSGDSTACPVCARKFSNQKSLFGHMRCHSDRLWRGMEPPPDLKTTDSSSSSSTSSDGGGDRIDHTGAGKELGFLLEKWPTSKRGRGPVSNPAAAAPPPPNEEEDEDKDDSFAAGHNIIKILSRQEEDGRPRPELELEDLDQIPETLIGVGVNSELYLSAIEVLMDGKRKREKEEREKAMMTTDEEANTSSLSSTPEKYKCNECSRYFPTHQALGGHRSSHNKFKLSVVNTATRDAAAAAAGQLGTPPPPLRRKRKGKLPMIIKTSDTDTDTDQHNGNAAAAAADAAAASNGNEGASTGLFAFDLNMAPEDEEGMEMDESSYDA